MPIARLRRYLWLNAFGLLEPRLDRIERQLDALASRVDVPDDLVSEFNSARESDSYRLAFTQQEPLVSVCVPTYNRAELLVERCLPSILNQTYKNLQVIVVGDGCTDDTPTRMARLDDSRIEFVSLPPRHRPSKGRWMAGATIPGNAAMELSTGAFITHLDDDDEFHPTRIEKLVEFAQQRESDVVFHPWRRQTADGQWSTKNAESFRYGRVGTCMVLYHHWLKRIPWDPECHRYAEPHDWNRFRKFLYLGAQIDRHPEALLNVYEAPKPK